MIGKGESMSKKEQFLGGGSIADDNELNMTRGLGFFFGIVVGGLVAVALGVAVAVLWLIF